MDRQDSYTKFFFREKDNTSPGAGDNGGGRKKTLNFSCYQRRWDAESGWVPIY